MGCLKQGLLGNWLDLVQGNGFKFIIILEHIERLITKMKDKKY